MGDATGWPAGDPAEVCRALKLRKDELFTPVLEEAVRGGFSPRPGIAKLVQECDQVAVCSNTRTALVAQVVEALLPADAARLVVLGSDQAAAKPAPDLSPRGHARERREARGQQTRVPMVFFWSLMAQSETLCPESSCEARSSKHV